MPDYVIVLTVCFVLWFFCGAIAAGIAESRGGDGSNGFIVGFIFGPLGVIASFFMGSASGRAQIEVATGAKKKCPRCAELVQPEALVCRYCGTEFSSGALERSATTTT
jgi:hypothetical protein